MSRSASGANTLTVGSARKCPNRSTCREVHVINNKIAERVRAGVIVLAPAESKITDDVFNAVYISAKLIGMITAGERNRVRDLDTPFVRERGAFKKLGYAKTEYRAGPA